MSVLRFKQASALLAGCFLIIFHGFVIAESAASQQAPLTAFSSLSFYVVGHQDDWELFHGNAAYNDLTNTTRKVVFIYATAGDAGLTDGWWEARERGALAAVRKAIGPAPLTVDIARINDHPILRYTCRNSVSYFLRLPDGKYGFGTGYPAYNNESLSQLRDTGKPVSAVDRSTTYRSWKDLWQTLRALMEYERSRAPAAVHPLVNAPDYFGSDNSHQDCASSKSCNPCDHPDHIAVGEALRQFVAGTYNRVWWVGYDTQNRPENLQGADLARKEEVFFAYGTAVLNETTANGNPTSPSLEEWRAWGGRDYIRTVSWDQPDPDNPECGTGLTRRWQRSP